MSFIFKITVVLIVTASNLCCKTTKQSRSLSDETITMLSYNVRNCVGMDNVVNYQRVADVIKKINPDIVAIQELDSATSRSKGVSVLDELARLTEMFPRYRASIDYQGGKYGIGILSKEKPLNVEGTGLPGKEEQRGVIVVQMKNYVLACSHFSLTEEDRVKSVEIIDQLTIKYSDPIFFAGDLNATPNSSVIKSFSKSWQLLSDTTQLTFPSGKPIKCIDYIMMRKQTPNTVKLLETGVENEPVASDHLPIWVKVKIERD